MHEAFRSSRCELDLAGSFLLRLAIIVVETIDYGSGFSSYLTLHVANFFIEYLVTVSTALDQLRVHTSLLQHVTRLVYKISVFLAK